MSRAIASTPVGSPPPGDPPQHPAPPDRRWLAAVLPFLLFGWMYGGSLLLLLGVLNGIGYMVYGARPLTGWYYGSGVIVALAVPAGGLILARLLRRSMWVRYFRTALALSVLAPCLAGMAWSVTQSPRFEPPAPTGTPTEIVESPNPYQDCVSISGGTNTCPGG